MLAVWTLRLSRTVLVLVLGLGLYSNWPRGTLSRAQLTILDHLVSTTTTQNGECTTQRQ
jgi:hypothetical protein